MLQKVSLLTQWQRGQNYWKLSILSGQITELHFGGRQVWLLCKADYLLFFVLQRRQAVLTGTLWVLLLHIASQDFFFFGTLFVVVVVEPVYQFFQFCMWMWVVWVFDLLVMFFFVSYQWTLCALLLMSWGWSWHVAAQTVPSLSSPPQVGKLRSFGVYLPCWYLSEKNLNFTSFHWTMLKVPFSSPSPQVYVGRFYSIGEGDTFKIPLQKYSKCFCFLWFLGIALMTW